MNNVNACKGSAFENDNLPSDIEDIIMKVPLKIYILNGTGL